MSVGTLIAADDTPPKSPTNVSQPLGLVRSVNNPANMLGYYNMRFRAWTPQDDEKTVVTVQAAIGQHDAKTFLRRYGCEGPVAKHIFANLNTLFASYR